MAWAYDDNPKEFYAGFDNQKSAYNLTKLVLSYGHKNIAVIAGVSKNNDRAAGRLLGIKKAIENHGAAAKLVDIIETKYRVETGGDAFDQIMSKSIKPSVIMCGNDVLAAGVIKRAKQRGIRIPEDVSVTGFDDLNIASVVSPTLTTVQVPHFAMGRSAAEILLNLIEGGAQTKSIEFDTEIIIRDSLALLPRN